MAEALFDRTAFRARLATRALGRVLVARAETGSTNDLAWDALARGIPDGAAFVADAQTRGRGREGRAWVSPPGQGLLLSVAVRLGCERDATGLLPLVAGLALVQGLERCGAQVELKWPNDVMSGGRKLAGVLCEARALPGADRAAVIGVGVNVTQRPEDFAEALRGRAVSLAMSGVGVGRERVAAEFLNALEPLLDDFQEGGGAARARERYRRRATFWGQAVTVRAAGRVVHGVARDLDSGGGLVLRLEDGRETVAVAGDLEPAGEVGP